MVSRLLIGDNNLSKFWPAFQFARPNLKHSVLVTATDLDGLDHALSKTEEREQVIVSELTSVLLDEINQDEVGSSAFNVCEQVVTRLLGLCPSVPSCQVSRLLVSCILLLIPHFLFLLLNLSNPDQVDTLFRCFP